MSYKIISTTFVLALWAVSATAQQTTTAVPRGDPDTSIFAALDIAPAPGVYRSADGTPGPKYWQNRADYDLKATIEDSTGTVRGAMVMRYTNHSPNALDVIWVQTEQNAFRQELVAEPGDSSAPHTFGDVIDHFTQIVGGQSLPVQLEDHKTETKVTLREPLKPGQTAIFDVAWHFLVPSGVPRMGREGSLYQIAQWYPRVNVYDDVKGWNIEPYLTEGEFFLEYGDFTLEVTVPATYVVVATGTLDNPADVLTPAERTRLAQASATDTVVHIVTAAELASGVAHLKRTGMATWKFHATNVRDMVFAASPEYLWDATSWKGVLANAYYRPNTTDAWSDVADMARMSIQEYSERWFPYPYPQISVAEGPVPGGMEYPMLSFDGTFPKFIQYLVITHEVGHNWFPMIVGSNERMHAWMDEGVNSFINTFSEARRYPEQGDQTARGNQKRAIVQEHVAGGQDLQVDVPADGAPNNQYSAYDKPAGVLQLLRRDVMGPERFDQGLRTYIRDWAYKHPAPQDFFRAMNRAAGRRLDWFWREWFFETPGFDQAIDSVSQTTKGDTTHITVAYGNRSRGVLPLLVQFTFSDGTTQDVTYPADIWMANSTRYVVSYTFLKKTVTQILLDPGQHLVDANISNNLWAAP